MDTDRQARVEGDTGIDETEKEGEKPKGRGCGCWIIAALVLLGALGAGGMVGAQTLFRTETPLPMEREAADLMKRWIMVPPEFTDRRIPERASISVNKGKQLWGGDEVNRENAVSCILCHGVSGSGDSIFGRNMYPPASNLWSDSTKSKTDGQLYWLIAHGINLSGMPAFGDAYKGPYTEDEIWSLVSYIRTFPRDNQ